MQKSQKGKIVRRTEDMAKYEAAQFEQMEDEKSGKIYGSGVALKTAKKQAKEKVEDTAQKRKWSKTAPKEEYVYDFDWEVG